MYKKIQLTDDCFVHLGIFLPYYLCLFPFEEEDERREISYIILIFFLNNSYFCSPICELKREAKCGALDSFSCTSMNHADVVYILGNRDSPQIILPLGLICQTQIQASAAASQGGVQQRYRFGQLWP